MASEVHASEQKDEEVVHCLVGHHVMAPATDLQKARTSRE